MDKRIVITKWITEAHTDNKNRSYEHFLNIEDKMIGLKTSKIKLQKAYDHVNKYVKEGEEKHLILNYLIGVM